MYVLTAWNDDIYDGTPTNPKLKKVLNEKAMSIVKDTLGLVRPKDMVLLLTAGMSRRLVQSPELQTYLSSTITRQLISDVRLRYIYGFKIIQFGEESEMDEPVFTEGIQLDGLLEQPPVVPDHPTPSDQVPGQPPQEGSDRTEQRDR